MSDDINETDDINEVGRPITDVLMDTVLLSVFNLFERIGSNASTAPAGSKAFMEAFTDPELLYHMLQRAWEDPDIDGDSSVEGVWKWIETKEKDIGAPVILLVADAIIAYATQAMKAESNSDFVSGWKFVGEARYWEGILNGIRMRKLFGSDSSETHFEIENPAVLMANSRHAETVALREEVVAYYHANVDPTWSIAKAAEFIAEKRIVPLTFRTIQSYISAEKKRLAPK